MRVSITVKGLDTLLRRLDGRMLLGGALRRAFDRVGIAVSNEAKERAPSFRGRLRNSITHQVDKGDVPRFVLIGTNVKYAKAVHMGRRPGSWPPRKPIALWVERKGLKGADGRPLNPFLVQRKIYRDGIKPKPFLIDALKDQAPRFQGFFDKAAQEVEGAWQT